MDFRIIANWKERTDELSKTAYVEQNCLDESGPASRIQSVQIRQSDISFFKEVKDYVLSVSERPDRMYSRALQHFRVQF